MASTLEKSIRDIEIKQIVSDFNRITEEKILFPFLFTSHAVLGLYLNNIYELYPQHVFRALFVTLLGAFIIYRGSRVFLNKNLSGLTTLLVAISISSFRLQVNLINPLFPEMLGYAEHYKKALLGLTMVNSGLIITVLSIARRSRFNLDYAVKTLNIASLLVFCTVISGIGFALIEDQTNIPEGFNLQDSESADNPNIYYIVPDKYTRADVLEEQYNFNNSNFLNSLKKEGFTVQKNTFGNYGASYASLASSLNADYLQNMGIGRNTSEKQVHRLLRDHRVQSSLKRRGYKYYHIGGYYTEFNRNADRSYYYSTSVPVLGIYMNRFEKFLLEKTLLGGLLTQRNYNHPTSKSFEKLSNLSQNKETKFVFTHVMSPHYPYDLARSVEGVKYYSKNEASERKRYVQEIKATNRLLEETVSEIRQNDEEAIIIIQGDEGPTLENDSEQFSEASNVKRKQSILFAHYTPEIEDSAFKDNINPANLFRIIFNKRFDTDFELLEGRTYQVNGGEKMIFQRKNLSHVIG